jgi:hypothetical protein
VNVLVHQHGSSASQREILIIMNNKLRNLLINCIKPELNSIFVTKPFSIGGGKDFGWYCREHALILLILGRLLKIESEIIKGDVIIKYRNTKISTVGDPYGHFWCNFGGITPVDISMCLRYSGIPEIALIYNNDFEVTKPYNIIYHKLNENSINPDANSINDAEIYYIEKNIENMFVSDLINNPYRFLLLPPNGFPKLTDIYGDDIFCAIAFHCYKLYLGTTKPLYIYLDHIKTLKKIQKWNNNAKFNILSMIEDQGKLL